MCNLRVAPRTQSTLQLVFNFKSCSSYSWRKNTSRYFTPAEKLSGSFKVASNKNFGNCGIISPHVDVRNYLYDFESVADRFNAPSNFNYHRFANSLQIVLHAGERCAVRDASLAAAVTLIVKDFIIFKQRVKVLARSPGGETCIVMPCQG